MIATEALRLCRRGLFCSVKPPLSRFIPFQSIIDAKLIKQIQHRMRLGFQLSSQPGFNLVHIRRLSQNAAPVRDLPAKKPALILQNQHDTLTGGAAVAQRVQNLKRTME